MIVEIQKYGNLLLQYVSNLKFFKIVKHVNVHIFLFFVNLLLYVL